MAFTEAFADYFADFGVDVTIGAATVRGIFDNAFVSSLGITAGSGPVLLLSAPDAASATEGSSLSLGGLSYTVTGIEPDGTGMTLLRLQEV